MGITELTYLIIPLLVGLLATAGYGVVALTPADFRKARLCFIVAAVLMFGLTIFWGMTTSVESRIVRALIVGVLGAAIAIALSELLRWTAHREALVASDAVINASAREPLSETKSATTAYVNCFGVEWADAEHPSLTSNEILFGNLAIASFGNPSLYVIRSNGPVNPDNHRQLKASDMPLRCEISFYTRSPIFNVNIKFVIGVYPSVRSGNSVSSGPNPIANLDADVQINQVEDRQKYVFYVYAFDYDAFVFVNIPKRFDFYSQDGTKVEGTILTSEHNIFMASPPAILPVENHPSQEPPRTPAGK